MPENPAARSTPVVQASSLGILAGILLWILLAGYLIANKPFAALGFPPVYIGEAVFGLALLAGLVHWRNAFLQPLRESWGLRCLAALWILGTLRALLDASTNGLLALRDGAMIGYALLAFLAPLLWRQTSKASANERLIAHVSNGVLPLALLATISAAGVLFGWWPRAFNLAVKVDFIAVAAAVGAWVSFIAGLRWIAVGGTYSQTRKRDLVYRWVLVAFYFGFSLWALSVVLRLPTRAVLAAIPFLLLILCLAPFRKNRARVAIGAALLVLIGAIVVLKDQPPKWKALSDRLELTQRTKVDINDLDARATKVLAGDVSALPEAVRGRFEMLLPPNDPAVSKGTSEHSLRWRTAFWIRCTHCTFDTAPLTGLGFGDNLTALLLSTRAWDDFTHSQQTNPPNRSPHSIHIHILTRLGLIGFVLWLAFLAFTFRAALRTIWRYRLSDTLAAKEGFYDTLLLFGVWIVVLVAASFGIVIEGPFGGMWFWALSGLLLQNNTITS